MQQTAIPNPNPKPVASVSPDSPLPPPKATICRGVPANSRRHPEDFSRRLKISSSPSPSPRPSQSTKARKLFNPDTDPIPMRRTDPEPILDLHPFNRLPALLPLHYQRIIEMREVTPLDIYSIIERTIRFVFP
jgi:protein SMG6